MSSIGEIYKRTRLTAEEVSMCNNTEERKAVILGWEPKTRTYKDEEYGYVELTVEFKKEKRSLQLSRENAYEISKSAGYDPDQWLNYILMLNAVPDEKGVKRLKVFVWGKA